MDIPKVAVAVVLRKHDTILIGKRKGSFGDGDWGVPGGKIDAGETPLEAAARELVEEAQLVAENYRRIAYYSEDTFLAHDTSFVTLYILADWVSGEPVIVEPHKCDGWQWFQWGQFPDRMFQGLPTLAQAYPHMDDLPLLHGNAFNYQT